MVRSCLSRSPRRSSSPNPVSTGGHVRSEVWSWQRVATPRSGRRRIVVARHNAAEAAVVPAVEAVAVSSLRRLTAAAPHGHSPGSFDSLGASIRRLSRTLGQASGSLNRGVDEVRIALERGLYLTAVARASGLSATPATTVGVGHEGSLVPRAPGQRAGRGNWQAGTPAAAPARLVATRERSELRVLALA